MSEDLERTVAEMKLEEEYFGILKPTASPLRKLSRYGVRNVSEEAPPV